MYISEDLEFKNFDDESSLFWKKTGIVYGDWYGGPNGDGTYNKWTTLTASEVNPFSFTINVYYSDFL